MVGEVVAKRATLNGLWAVLDSMGRDAGYGGYVIVRGTSELYVECERVLGKWCGVVREVKSLV